MAQYLLREKESCSIDIRHLIPPHSRNFRWTWTAFWCSSVWHTMIQNDGILPVLPSVVGNCDLLSDLPFIWPGKRYPAAGICFLSCNTESTNPSIRIAVRMSLSWRWSLFKFWRCLKILGGKLERWFFPRYSTRNEFSISWKRAETKCSCFRALQKKYQASDLAATNYSSLN